MRARLLTIVAALALSGCGGESLPTPVAPSPTTDVPSFPGGIDLRVVNALTGQPISGAVIEITGLGTLGTDGGWMVRLAPPTPGVRQIRVTAPGFVERRTALRFEPQNSITRATVSLIPSSFDLASFDQGWRTTNSVGVPRRLIRWLANPALKLHSSEFNGISGVWRSTGFNLSSQALGCIETYLKAALADMSGGALAFASTEILPPLPQFTNIPESARGAITFFASIGDPCQSLGGCAGRATNTDGSVTSGFVQVNSFSSTTTSCTPSPDRDRFRHLLGHALGLGDVTSAQSVMNHTGPGFRPDPGPFTEFDQQAISIQYQRPPGNQSPDIDPDTFTVN
jgi:hypothetical protein